MFCSTCGKEVEDSKFCPFCGSPIEAATAPAEEPAAEAAPEAKEAEAPSEEPKAEAEAPAETPAEEPAAEPEAPAEASAEEPAAEPAPSQPEILEPVEAISSEVTAVSPIETPAPAPSPIDEAAMAPAPAEAPAAAPAPEAAPEADSQVRPAPEAITPKKKSKKPLIIVLSVIAAVILLVGAGVGVFFYLLVQKYNKASEAFENGNYEESLELYTQLKTFKDSEYWAQCSQVELDYQKVDGLIETEDFDGAITILNEVEEFYEGDSKGREAKALKTECETVKEAFAQKDQKNYFEAKGKFNSLTKFKEKYASQVNLCDAHLAETNRAWMIVIANIYGIQTGDLELQFITSPKTDDDKFISSAYNDGTTDYDKINSIVKPADDEQKALVESAIKGLKYDNAFKLMEEKKYEEALAIFNELGDFLDASTQAGVAKGKIDELNKKYEEAQKYFDNGEFYKAKAAWTEISFWKDSADKASKCVQTMPENGSMKKGSGSITMNINAPAKINALLRVYNSSNEVVAQVFIAAGKSSSIKLNADTYTIKVAYGTEWYGETDLFGAKGAYLQLKNGTSDSFTLKKNYKYTLKLQSGTSGNVGSSTVGGGAAGM
jgi:hypothetical protein